VPSSWPARLNGNCAALCSCSGTGCLLKFLLKLGKRVFCISSDRS
jgi:hypothetical protein